MYKCDNCGASFQAPKNFYDEKHDEDYKICPYCRCDTIHEEEGEEE